MHSKTDKHHIWHSRRFYTSEADQALREQHLFIPRMHYDLHHNGIHADLLPPPKPRHDMVIGALALTEDFPRGISHVEAINRVAGYFEALGRGAIRCTEQTLALQIGENIFEQLEYIKRGIVECGVSHVGR